LWPYFSTFLCFFCILFLSLIRPQVKGAKAPGDSRTTGESLSGPSRVMWPCLAQGPVILLGIPARPKKRACLTFPYHARPYSILLARLAPDSLFRHIRETRRRSRFAPVPVVTVDTIPAFECHIPSPCANNAPFHEAFEKGALKEGAAPAFRPKAAAG